MMSDRVDEGFHTSEKFKFKREKDRLLFRDSDWFGNIDLIVTFQMDDETFHANKYGQNPVIRHLFSYYDGELAYSDESGGGIIRSFLAECEIW